MYLCKQFGTQAYMTSKKKKKQHWFVPAGLEPTEMDLKIMEWEAKGKLVPTRNLIKTKEQIEGVLFVSAH